MAYDITPELPIFQKMIDLLSTHKMLYIEYSSELIGEARPRKTLFDVDDIKALRSLDPTNITILFPLDI